MIHPTKRFFGVALVLLSCLASGQLVLTQAAPKTSQPAGAAIASPQRRSEKVVPPPPPELPADAEHITPATIAVPPKTIVRTVDRIVVSGPEGDWVFQRNVLDHRRVSATHVDHAAQVLVTYEESDLLMALGIRGWADVLTFGSGPSELASRLLTPGVDPQALRDPHERFASYRRFDRAAWLEER